jgi:hypothetical protein
MYKIDEEELHELARLFMDSIPRFKPMSLDEFMCEYSDELTQLEKDLGYHILVMFDSEIE